MNYRALIVGCLLSGTLFSLAHELESKRIVTVFIHGTVGSFLHLGALRRVFNDTLRPQDVQLQQAFRKHPLIEVDQLASARLGMHSLDTSLVENYPHKLPEYECDRAWYHLVAAYHACLKASGCIRPDETRIYALFGWNGALAHTQRKEASRQLYHELVRLRELYAAQDGTPPIFHLIGHSHGGNVGLYLHDIEQENKQGLSIQKLHLLGTPILPECKDNILSSMFVDLISWYSHNDEIQTKDFFSGLHHTSHNKLDQVADIRQLVSQNTHMQRADVKLVINRNHKHIDHAALFMAGRGKIISSHMPELPFFVFMPLAYESLEKNRRCTSRIIDYRFSAQEIQVHVYHCTTKLRTRYAYPISGLKTVYVALKEKWRPFESGRHSAFNAKNLQMLWDVVTNRGTASA